MEENNTDINYIFSLLNEPQLSEEDRLLLTKKLLDCFVNKFTERVKTNFIPKLKHMLYDYTQNIPQDPYESNRLEILSRIDAMKKEILQDKKKEKEEEKKEDILSILNPLNLLT